KFRLFQPNDLIAFPHARHALKSTREKSQQSLISSQDPGPAESFPSVRCVLFFMMVCNECNGLEAPRKDLQVRLLQPPDSLLTLLQSHPGQKRIHSKIT